MEQNKAEVKKEEQPIPEVKKEVQVERVFKVDEYYPENHKERTIVDSSIPASRATKFHEVFGQESYRRYNLQYLAKDILIFISGNSYQIYNVQTKERKVFFGKDTGGIGSIAVHPSKTFYAVAEKGDWPNIYVYEYPSGKLYRVLRKGTTNYYSSIDFSPSGDRLASVGGDPDYQLSIWDWRQEKCLLKSKAFSQEVFKCGFSPYGDFSLITSGTGHIRFWKIAQTFTGLKLQSEIGKFGQLELSDVSSFAELASGLVLSGTEYGTLLLWDGNLVKAHIKLVGGEPLHKGMIEQIIIKDTYVVTAGADGFIKWFDLNTIANTEPDETLTLEIKQIYAFQIKSQHGTPAYIVNILQGPDHWLIQDGKGRIWNLNTETKEYKEVLHFHSGRISDLILNNETNAGISLGSDGAIKLWDYTKSMEVYTRQFTGEGLCIDWMPRNSKNLGRVLATGFAEGVVRIILLGNQNFQLLTAFKALDSDVVKVAYSPDGGCFVAAGSDGSIFFFEVNVNDLQHYEPICLAETKQKINDLRWHKDSKRILIACETGNVIEIMRPDKTKLDTKASYLVELPTKMWTIKMMESQMKKNQQKDESEEEKRRRKILMYTSKDANAMKEEEEKEWEPAPILTCMYYSEDINSFMITADREYRGYVYICKFDQPRPIKGIDYSYRNAQCLSLNIYPTEDILSIGLSNGRYQIRSMLNYDKYIEVNGHDSYTGKLKKVMVSAKKTYVLSAGEDGLIFVYKLNGTILEKCVKYYEDRAIEDVKPDDLEKIYKTDFEDDKESIEKLELEKPISLAKEVNIDIDPKTILSIQKAKLKAEEDAKQKQAMSKKDQMRADVEKLREQYNKILKANLNEKRSEIPPEFDEIVNVDHDYFETLSKQINDQIQEVCKELEYDKEKHRVAVEKLKAEYLNPLEYGITTLKGIKSTAFVRTFRLTKLAEFIEAGLKEQEELAKAETNKKKNLDTTEEDFDASGGNSPMVNSPLNLNKTKAGATFHIEPVKGKELKKTTAELNQEKRRQDRLLKKEEKESIKKMQPKDEDDPVYKAKMDAIVQNNGEKKLKSDENYDVPEEQRRDAKKQRYEMLLLAKGLYNIQKFHNDKVLALRDRKAAIIEKATQVNQRVAEINKILGKDEKLFQPTTDLAAEYPDKYYEIKDEDLIAHLQREKEQKEQNPDNERRNSEEAEVKHEDHYDAYLIERPKEISETVVVDENALPPERKDYVREKSTQETEQEKIRQIELLYEKDTLVSELNKEISDFDNEIETLQHMKLKLESDKKYGEMKLIMGYESLCMLKGLVDRDTELTERLGKCKQEKIAIAKQFNEIAQKMKDKEMVMNNLKEEKDQIMARFDELIPLNHKDREEMYSFFMRKIRRKAKPAEEEKPDDAEGDEKEDEVQEESEEEEDKNAWDEDDDAKNQPGGPNKEQNHVDQVIEERAKKLDLEDKLKKMGKENAELQKKSMDLERQKNRIDQEERMIDEEIKVFQREKMKRLNKMEQSFVLRLSQIQNLEQDLRQDKKDRYDRLRARRQELAEEIKAKNDEAAQQNPDGQVEFQKLEGRDECIGYILPPDLHDSLLFTEDDIRELLRKKAEHESKKKEEETLQASKQTDTKRKETQIGEKEKEVKRKQQILEDELQLKFGSVIKLDEEIPWTANTENIKKKEAEFSKAETALNAKIKAAELELESKKRELSEQVKRNTDLLKHIKVMGEKSTELQKKLNNANEQIFKMDNAEQRNKLIEEKNELEEKLNVQNYKIDTIRKEIELFRRKGGHIYTTITANRRVAGGTNNAQ